MNWPKARAAIGRGQPPDTPSTWHYQSDLSFPKKWHSSSPAGTGLSQAFPSGTCSVYLFWKSLEMAAFSLHSSVLGPHLVPVHPAHNISAVIEKLLNPYILFTQRSLCSFYKSQACSSASECLPHCHSDSQFLLPGKP